MEGRETGKKGGKTAANYIASIFRKIEIDSVGYNGYFQKFNLTTDSLGNTDKHYFVLDDSIHNLQAQNIIAFIEGSQHNNETIVISAHYDHLGKRNDSTIYYGADDNASGVASLIEIARVMQIAANHEIKPARNILFLAFDAEEKGWLGSTYFLNNLPDTLGSILLNINLDMIGRNRYNDNKYDQSVFMVSKGKKRGYYKRLIRKSNNSNHNLSISRYPRPFSNIALRSFSDHFVFMKKGIPFIHFQTGMHKDYHTINDTPDKINYKKLTEFSKFLCNFVWEVSNTGRKLI
jgi:Zn-dependent M28 family amino/carboxypeptidase